MAEFPLLPIPNPERDRRPTGPRGGSSLRLPSRARQGERLQPVFQRLRDVFDADRDPVTLREDPTGIAPERALVLDVAGGIDDFYRAAQRIDGLEYLGDEEADFEPDQDFAEPDTRKDREGEYRTDKPVVDRLYLAMPDTRALQQLVRLWDRYQAGERAQQGFRPWFDLFDRLRELRAWGPLDRIPENTITWLTEALAARADPVRVEIELWSHRGAEQQRRSSNHFERAVRDAGGEIRHRASIPDIAYEAALVDLPAAEALRLRQREQSPLALCDDVMRVLPQSTAEFPTAVDTLGAGGMIEPAPLPASLERVTEPRAITLTLAWFSPVNVRHRAYRRAKLELQPIDFKTNVGVGRVPEQPSDKSVPRGSLFHVRYSGDKAVAFVADGHMQFRVFCRPQGGALDQAIRYGLAVTIEAGEHVPVYQEVRQRLGIQPQAPGSAP